MESEEPEPELQFDTSDGRPNRCLPDPNLTPILIPISIRAPYFKLDSTSTTPYSALHSMPISENDTVESFTENQFRSAAMYCAGGNQEILQSAFKHDRDAVVILITSRGRLLVIPRATRIKDIFAGARWPRPPGSPVFDDLRKKPRARSDEIDGVELTMGWLMELCFIDKENLSVL